MVRLRGGEIFVHCCITLEKTLFILYWIHKSVQKNTLTLTSKSTKKKYVSLNKQFVKWRRFFRAYCLISLRQVIARALSVDLVFTHMF